MSESDKKYLIRSSGHIFGPYDQEEIKQLMKAGTISISDEVIEPYSVAFYLRDHPDFSDFVLALSKEKKLTSFISGLNSKLFTITNKTIKSNQEDTQTITETVTETVKASYPNKKEAEDADFKLIKGSIKKSPLTAKSVVSKKNEKVNQNQLRKQGRKLQFLGIIFALGLISFIIFKEFILPYQKQRDLSNQINEKGQRFYQSGNYQKALEIYQKGLDSKILNIDGKKILLNLFINNRNTKQAKILLSEIKDSLSPENILMIKGVLALIEDSDSLAEKNFLKLKNNEMAILNLALLKWKQQDYRNVSRRMNVLISGGYERGIIFYLKILSFMKLERNKNHIKRLIKNSLELSPEYQQELQILLAYLHINEESVSAIEKRVKKILNWDPYFDKNYNYDSLIPAYILDWSIIFPYCEKLFQRDTNSPYLNALYGYCYLKIGSSAQGLKYIEKSKNLKSQDQMIISVLAYGLMIDDNFKQAEIVLNEIEESSYNLTNILKAKVFQKKQNWDLAIIYWGDILEEDSYHPSALGGVAYSYYKLQDYDQMKIYKNRGLEHYPYHVQLLSLP